MEAELSPWAASAILDEDDYGLMRAMAANSGLHLVGNYGAERYRFAELEKAALVRRLSSLHRLSPGYELTRRGWEWAERDTADR